MMKLKKSQGFTLIELMIVVAIIGILAAVAIPKFADLVTKSKEAALKGNIGSIRSAISIYYGDTEGVYPGNLFEALTTGNKYMPSIQGAPSLGKYPVPKNSYGAPGHTAAPYDNANKAAAVTQAAVAAADDKTPLLYNDPVTGGAIGEALINCTHMDTKNSSWTTY